MLTRREWIAAGLALPVAAHAKNQIGLDRISLLTDEVARTPGEAFAFAHKYNVKWLELRRIPGEKRNYFDLTGDELKQTAKQFRDEGIRISFLNSGMCKFGLPGTAPLRRTPETPDARTRREEREKKQFDERYEYLDRCIRAAEAYDVDKIRVFTFSRVQEPEPLFPRIAEIISDLGERARKSGMKLMIENEGSCNVATSAESAKFLAMIKEKNVGLNWDPGNGYSREKQFPEGYALLPKKRIGHVQMKGKNLLEPNMKIDWNGIFRALERDGYKGKIGLETHYLDGTDPEKSVLCMDVINKLVLPS